jgi:hypothetical protein
MCWIKDLLVSRLLPNDSHEAGPQRRRHRAVAICGTYAKHKWTRAPLKNRTCARCGVRFLEGHKAAAKPALRQSSLPKQAAIKNSAEPSMRIKVPTRGV